MLITSEHCQKIWNADPKAVIEFKVGDCKVKIERVDLNVIVQLGAPNAPPRSGSKIVRTAYPFADFMRIYHSGVMFSNLNYVINIFSGLMPEELAYSAIAAVIYSDYFRLEQLRLRSLISPRKKRSYL